jgi:hypothetical protein
VLPPEVLISPNFKPILESREWRTRLKHVRVDECHCITTWASFRPEFRRFNFLTDQFPHALFYFTSATITDRQSNHIKALFGLKQEDTKVIRLSNERTNVQIVITEMVYPSATHKDLLRFLHPIPSASKPCRPFLVYVNSITEAESAATFLCAVLKEIDPAIEDKVTWVHSLSSKEHLDRVIKGLANGGYWGVISTEILGMVRLLSAMVLYDNILSGGRYPRSTRRRTMGAASFPTFSGAAYGAIGSIDKRDRHLLYLRT